MSTPITPATKVAELLKAYPELEDVLVGIAPPFAKLKNPVLRRTIAKVATLERAAGVAGIPVRDLVLQLREAAGLPALDESVPTDAAAGVEDTEVESLPDWARDGEVTWELDADAWLAEGRQPLGEALAQSRALVQGQVGVILSGFRPLPLIDLLHNEGMRTALEKRGERFRTVIGPA